MKIIIIAMLMFNYNLQHGGYEIIQYNKTIEKNYDIVDYAYHYASERILLNYYKTIDLLFK